MNYQRERRQTALKLLIAHPERSNRWIATDCNVSPQAVAYWRDDLEVLGIIKPQPVRDYIDGRKFDTTHQYKVPGNQYTRR